MNAPVCPISIGQQRLAQPSGTYLPVVPPASDLQTLLFTVNAIRDILLTMTVTRTANNTYNTLYLPNTATRNSIGTVNQKGSKYYSAYPSWLQVAVGTSTDFVYHHDSKGYDLSQRSNIQRLDAVQYRNVVQQDPDFVWAYYLKIGAPA